MSTYEELLKHGTNEFSTNAIMKAAMDAQDEAYQQAVNAEIVKATTSFFWHIAMLMLLIIAVFFLWRISRQKKKESRPTRPTSQTQSGVQSTMTTRVDERHPTTKPPLLDSPSQTCQTR